MRQSIEDITAERERQINVEGFSEDHDDEHDNFQLSLAAMCYLAFIAFGPLWKDMGNFLQHFWPWDLKWWKPVYDNKRTNLVKAGALIVAEIDRIDRFRKIGG